MATFRTWLSVTLPAAPMDVWTTRFLDSEFPVGGESEQAAWDLEVELRTRIATEALPLHSGQEGVALKSLHTLFDTTRSTLHKGGPSLRPLGTLVMAVINEDLRPVTAYWHGVVGDGPFVHPDEAGDFRADLLDVQGKLRLLADYLGYVAHGERYHSNRLLKQPVRPTPRYSPPPLSAMTTAARLDALEATELHTINERRKYLGLPTLSSIQDAAGIALSGGGIRSATFGLGVLTALSRAGLYEHFDYLSTVSGGGYAGTVVSTWATAKAAEQDVEKPVDEAVRSALKEGPFRNDAVVEHLRDRSRYLIEGGIVGVARAALPILLGIVTSLATLLLTTAITLPLTWAGSWVFRGLSGRWQWILLGISALVVVASAGMRTPKHRSRTVAWGAFLLVSLAILVAPAAAVAIVESADHTLERAIGSLSGRVSSKAILAALPVVLNGLGRLLKRRQASVRLGLLLLALSPWITYALLLTVFAGHVAWPSWQQGDPSKDVFIGWLLALVGALVLSLLGDVNVNSPLGYYRDRLTATYCVSTRGDLVLPSASPPLLQGLTPLAPIHLINATVNLPASRARNDRGRGAAALAFSRHGWTYPSELEGRIVHQHVPIAPMDIDAGLAMAVSGAAISSWMGTLAPAGASPWLTLFNLRLGAWLPNPARPDRSLPWGYYLMREFLGAVGLNNRRLNISDGGHFENLGVYELIRRRCSYIVAIDGEADGNLECRGLMNLIRLSRIDFGADIRIDVRKFKLNSGRLSCAHVAAGKITYANGKSGILLYVKLSVTGDEPAHLLAYRIREPVFPHHSTAEQIFSEEQFECYRALGQHVGEQLFHAELVGDIAAKAVQHAGCSSNPAVELDKWIAAIQSSLQRERPFSL